MFSFRAFFADSENCKSTSTMGVSVTTGSENPSPPSMPMILRKQMYFNSWYNPTSHISIRFNQPHGWHRTERCGANRGSDLVREHDAVTMEDPLTIELITPEYGTYNLGVTMKLGVRSGLA